MTTSTYRYPPTQPRAADSPAPARHTYVCYCPQCGYRPTEADDALFGGFEHNGIMFTVCPSCGADWPDC